MNIYDFLCSRHCSWCFAHMVTLNLPIHPLRKIFLIICFGDEDTKTQSIKQKQQKSLSSCLCLLHRWLWQSMWLKVQALCPHPTPNHLAYRCLAIFGGYPHSCPLPHPWVFSLHNYLKWILFLSFSTMLKVGEEDSSVDKRKPGNTQNIFLWPCKYRIKF